MSTKLVNDEYAVIEAEETAEIELCLEDLDLVAGGQVNVVY